MRWTPGHQDLVADFQLLFCHHKTKSSKEVRRPKFTVASSHRTTCSFSSLLGKNQDPSNVPSKEGAAWDVTTGLDSL